MALYCVQLGSRKISVICRGLADQTVANVFGIGK